MKKTIALAMASIMVLATAAYAAEATFSWLPNKEPDIAGYKIYYGQAADNLDQVIDVGLPATGDDGRVRATIPIPDTASCFAATAYDDGGNESDFSNKVTCDPPPAPPGVVSVVTVHVEVTVR